MLAGGLTVIIWIVSGLSAVLYEMVPGFAVALIVVLVVSLMTKEPDESVNKEFLEMERILEEIK